MALIQSPKVIKMLATISEEKKREQSSITLKIKGLDENVMLFRIKCSTLLKELIDVFCDCQSVDRDTILFIFDGRYLSGEKTPYELGLKDGDEIEAQQSGKSIALRIKYLKRNVVLCRVNCSNPLKKLMNDFCDNWSVDRNAILFSFDGQVLSGDKTPYELGLKDGDKIEAEQFGECITLKIKDENDIQMVFRIGRDTPLKKYMDDFCDLVSVDKGTLAFLLDECLLSGKKTPNELGLEDEDQIDATLHLSGGGAAV